jgi:hypothetical protein
MGEVLRFATGYARMGLRHFAVGIAHAAIASNQRLSRRSGIRFADKDMRQHENRRRFPGIRRPPA